MDELRTIDAHGPHPPLWWIISGEDRALCYVRTEKVWNGARSTHEWVTTAWNEDGFRAVYSEEECRVARLEVLARPVRPQTEIQDVILTSIEEDVVTPRSGIELYRETIADEEPVPAGEGRSHG